MRIIVAGCGIGGSAVALALQRRGMDFVVVEQAERFAEVGAGIQLSPNGVLVLKQLGLDKVIAEVAFEPHDLRYRDWQSGETLLRTPLKPLVADHFKSPYFHAHRADLIEALTRPLDSGRLHMGRRIQHVDQDENGVSVFLDDGTVERGDVLIGADGIHSLVRTQKFAPDTPSNSGCIAWRGVVDAKEAAHLGILPSAHIWMGPGHSAVVYFVSGGSKINWICIGNVPQNRAESWSATATVEEVTSVYRGWNRELLDLVMLTKQPFVTALYDRKPLDHWVDGRIALMGDAAHAMLPYHAQGAVQSLEDAWVLARLLGMCDGKPEAALLRYEELRKDRATRVQAQSRVAERRLHLSDPAEVEARNAKFRRYNAAYDNSYLPQQEWLFGYDAEQAALGQDHHWQSLRPW